MTRARFMLLGMSLLALPWPPNCTAAPTDTSMSVEELCAHLKENEAKLLNVRVTAQYQLKYNQGAQGWDDAKGWKAGYETAAMAWFEGRPWGKYKVNLFPITMAGTGGSNVFSVSGASAFNGSVGQVLSENSKQNPANGNVGPKRPRLTTEKMASGWMFASPGIAEDLAEMLLSESTNNYCGLFLSEVVASAA